MTQKIPKNPSNFLFPEVKKSSQTEMRSVFL